MPDLGILGPTHYLRLQHCDIGAVETSDMLRQERSLLKQEKMSSVDAGQMSAVEKRQVYSIKTGLTPVVQV